MLEGLVLGLGGPGLDVPRVVAVTDVSELAQGAASRTAACLPRTGRTDCSGSAWMPPREPDLRMRRFHKFQFNSCTENIDTIVKTSLAIIGTGRRNSDSPTYQSEIHLSAKTKTTLSTRWINRNSHHMSSVHITAGRYCFATGILTLDFQWFIENNIHNFTQRHNAAMVIH
jgi:hypothetical protein